MLNINWLNFWSNPFCSSWENLSQTESQRENWQGGQSWFPDFFFWNKRLIVIVYDCDESFWGWLTEHGCNGTDQPVDTDFCRGLWRIRTTDICQDPIRQTDIRLFFIRQIRCGYKQIFAMGGGFSPDWKLLYVAILSAVNSGITCAETKTPYYVHTAAQKTQKEQCCFS